MASRRGTMLVDGAEFCCGAIRVLLCFVYWLCFWVIRRLTQILGIGKLEDLSGEVVVITGAGSGVGKNVALRLATRGCSLVLLGKRLADLATTVELLKGLGTPRVHTYACDCNSESSIKRTVVHILRDVGGKVTVLVNNAGVVHPGHFDQLLSDEIQETISVNLLAHFWLTKALLPSLKQQRRSHIVCISSVAGLFGASGLAPYCASKAGVIGMCESLAMDLHLEKQDHVKVTCVCPYQINTDMFAGVQLKYPWLFPVLDVEYVSQRVVECFFTDRHLVILPKSMYLLNIAKTILPHAVLLKAADFLGITTAMEGLSRGTKTD